MTTQRTTDELSLEIRGAVALIPLTRPANLGLKKIHGSSFAADVDQTWRTHLEGEHLLEFVTVVTVVRTMEVGFRVPFFQKAARRIFREDTEARLANLREIKGRRAAVRAIGGVEGNSSLLRWPHPNLARQIRRRLGAVAWRTSRPGEHNQRAKS